MELDEFLELEALVELDDELVKLGETKFGEAKLADVEVAHLNIAGAGPVDSGLAEPHLFEPHLSHLPRLTFPGGSAESNIDGYDTFRMAFLRMAFLGMLLPETNLKGRALVEITSQVVAEVCDPWAANHR